MALKSIQILSIAAVAIESEWVSVLKRDLKERGVLSSPLMFSFIFWTSPVPGICPAPLRSAV